MFTRFVELGRVVLITYGPLEGKLAVIVNIIDQNKALIDGPSTVNGVERQAISFKRIALTDIVLPGVTPGMNVKSLTKKWEKADAQAKWDASSWAKRRAVRAARAKLNDFDRFKLRKARRKVAHARHIALKAAKA